MGRWAALGSLLQRKRVFHPEQLESGNLRRCLTVWDLIALGVGSTLGVGVYVLVGSVAMNFAGPAIVLSFLIAAIASLFAGLCYAEFGSRVPRAGSAYIYTYVTMGQLVAFIVGWNMILEALFATASVARGLSMYVDSMVNKTMSEAFLSVAPISIQPFSPYFDFFAFGVVIVLGVVLAVGVRQSATVNNIFALINIVVIVFIVVAGAVTANPSNWSIPGTEVPANFGKGGFFPYGIWGVFKGAAVCFYGFVGFDSISATGEEVKDPRRVIPIAILAVLVLIFFVYAAVSTVITMMVPYYLQDTTAALASAFSYVGWEWARWLVSIGAIFGISASLYGAMFPLPRLLYAMSSDGLLLRWLGHVTAANQSPTVATVLPALVIAILAGVLELQELVMMMCVGTLLSYTIVAICVIILRYRSDSTTSTGYCFIRRIFCCGEKSPSQTTSLVVKICLSLFTSICLSTALVLTHIERPLIPTAILHLLALLLITVIATQPQNKEELSFKTPLVPLIPCLSIYVNVNLMILISVQTWIRVLIWMAIGIPVYIVCACCYKANTGDGESKNVSYINKNGKPPIQIFIESPTPPDTIKYSATGGDQIVKQNGNTLVIRDNPRNTLPLITEEITIQNAYIEDTTEKEAKIIDLLDQVIQAEEDSFSEIISLKEQKNVSEVPVQEKQRKSLSELSDAGSDISSNQALSKYDVIAQVHREDLPKLEEEDEIKETSHLENKTTVSDQEEVDEDKNSDLKEEQNEDSEEIIESDANSRTDESGYSDTLDKTPLNEIIEDKEISNIPTPPPLDETFFASPTFIKSYTIPVRATNARMTEPQLTKSRETVQSNGSIEDEPMTFGSDTQINSMTKDKEISNIPTPPPLDENFFASPTFIKSYTISARPTKVRLPEPQVTNKPRESVQSNGSVDDEPMTFGSDKQIHFMTKLNTIFQNKISESSDSGDQKRTRSNSAGNLTENTEFATLNHERPQLFLDLKKEMLSREANSLKPVKIKENNPEEESEDESMSKDDLKSKLENIFATGGPKPRKARLMKSNPPSPEEAYQTDTSSIESLPKMPKIEKNDTLKRQKDKFGEVLNSLRLSLRDDQV
ncbi:cationic amino acid transporter 2 [Pieris rapae]|uniref:cationic amino acid transporter 2 n=1 Tax=Pieris rapae TaxID=64459 RepID=UPI001E27FE92|nr:cationic amino acid transporter 2 [Pieris rapae]